MRTALINQSQADQKAIPLIAEALALFGRQFAADYSYDASAVEVQVFDDPAKPPAGWVKAIVQDKLDTEGAPLAYHDRDEQGNPIIYAGFLAIPNGELFHGAQGDGASLLGELQHEWAETRADLWANAYADLTIVDPQGSGKTYHQVAIEVEDPCQEICDTFTVNGTKCDRTNYVLPAWFDPSAPKGTKVDRIGVLPGPGTVAAGGYVIVRETFTKDDQIFARGLRLDHHVPMRSWRAKKKSEYKHGRTARRLGQVVRVGRIA